MGQQAYGLQGPRPLYETRGTPSSFLLRGFVSDFSGEGPSEAPVCRDQASEAWQNKHPGRAVNERFRLASSKASSIVPILLGLIVGLWRAASGFPV